MPQMFPLNWISLFLFFCIIFLLFNIMTYFNFIFFKKKMKKINKNFYFKKINWKW